MVIKQRLQETGGERVGRKGREDRSDKHSGAGLRHLVMKEQ